MNVIVELVGLFALLFAACVGASYVLTSAARRRRAAPAPPLNATVRFKTGGAMYRSRFLGVTEVGWVLSPPLQRDHYVPIREGEEVRGEIVTPEGVQFFRTTVALREMTPPRLILKVPEFVDLRERRESPRRTDLEGIKAGLEGEPAVLMDLSDHGARVASSMCPDRGERVALQLPWLSGPQFAYVLESAPHPDNTRTGCEIRLRFES